MTRPSQQPQNSGDTPAAQTPPSTTIETPNPTDQTQLTTSNNQSLTTLNLAVRLPVAVLVLRITTFVSLITSLIIITSDTATVNVTIYTYVRFHFKSIYAYRYMVWCLVIGLIYSCLQVPFAIYRVSIGKLIVNHPALPKFDFFGDKIILSLLATGVGAAFGATIDLKKNLDDIDDQLKLRGDSSLSQLRSKLDNFFVMGNVAAGFLLIAVISSGASSIISSLALSRK